MIKILLVFSLFSYNTFATSKITATSIYSAKLIPVDKRVALPDMIWKSVAKKSFNLKEYRGRVLYLNYWAQWCAPCKTEIPILKNIMLFFNKGSVKLLFVNMDKPDTKSQKVAFDFFRKNILPFESVFTGAFKFENKLDVKTLPMHYLIDKNGKIAANYYGSVKTRKLEKKITTMLYKLAIE